MKTEWNSKQLMCANGDEFNTDLNEIFPDKHWKGHPTFLERMTSQFLWEIEAMNYAFHGVRL